MSISANELSFRHRTLKPNAALEFTWTRGDAEPHVRVAIEDRLTRAVSNFVANDLVSLYTGLVEAFKPYDDEVNPYTHTDTVLEDFGTYLVEQVGETLDGWVPVGEDWFHAGATHRLMYLPNNDVYQITHTSYDMPYLGGAGYSAQAIKRTIEKHYNQNPYALVALEENEQEKN